VRRTQSVGLGRTFLASLLCVCVVGGLLLKTYALIRRNLAVQSDYPDNIRYILHSKRRITNSIPFALLSILNQRTVTTKAVTRKPSYRKDDSAVRPMYESPEKFQESLRTPTVTHFSGNV